MPQYYNITHLFCFLLLYYPRWAIQRRSCDTLTETVVPRNVQHSKTHQQPPFSMAIISTLSSKTTLPISYCLKRNVQGTSISSGHNYVCLYFVYHSIEPDCTQMMCFMFKCRPDSILHKPSYYSAWHPRDFWVLVSRFPAIWIFFPMLSDNTSICALPSLSIQCFEHSTWSRSEPESRRFYQPRDFGHWVNPNPADFLDRDILVSEWTRIPRIFSTAGCWSRSEPKSRGFYQPWYFGPDECVFKH